MKVAIVHDDLVQWGGAERVLLAMAEVFPDAPIYTSVFDSDHPLLRQHFRDKIIITSFLQKIPAWRNLYKVLLPLYPIAFEQFDLTGFDLVISQTTRFAKAIITKPATRHICYCHTPPRFLWHYSGETTPTILSPYLSFLRIYDTMSSHRVDNFWAGSVNAQTRLKENYHVDADLLYPFVDHERFKGVESFDGGYYLIISRLNFYKRIDLAVEVFNQIGEQLIIIGSGPELMRLQTMAQDNVQFLTNISEKLLTDLLAGCQALIVTAEEDFGLTALEAQVVGKPVIAFGSGGAKETVIDGITGLFFNEQTTDSLAQAVSRFKKSQFSSAACQGHAYLFSKDRFQQNLRQLVKLS